MAETRKAVVDNHGFRYYDPEIGRYLTRDPAGYVDGLNVYLYVGNNPINKYDPEGLEADKDGVPVTRDGHHVNPAANWKDNDDLSPDVRRRMNEQRVKPDVDSVEAPPRHGNSEGHTLYNKRAKAIQEEVIQEYRKKGIDPSKLTGKAADEFADDLMKGVLKDEYCAGFVALVKEGRGTRTELNALRAAFEKAGGKAGWLKALRGGKALPVLGTVATLYFVATSANAEEAIGAALPPGVGEAWVYASRRYDAATSGAQSIGQGNATPEQLRSSIPFIQGISQSRAAEHELYDDPSQ